jgi:hypothetical protein
MHQREHDDEETELAFGLLDAASPEEFDRAIGTIVSRAARRAGRPLSPAIRGAVYQLLARLARRVLPIVASVATEGVPASASGTAGNAVRAGRMLGLDLEGLSADDQELELARQFVRLAISTGCQAADASAGPDPAHVARTAAARAARRHAPGLVGAPMSGTA